MNLNVFSHQLPSHCSARRKVITVTTGDTIYHQQHGIGTVQSIRKRSFSGASRSKFAQLFFPRNEITMIVREMDLGETVRKPIARKTASEVLAYIGEWDEPVSEQWKARANALQAKLDNGDPFELAEVYKALSLRKAADNLSTADRRQLSQSESRLSEELGMAFGQSQAEVLQLMETSALG